MIIPMPSFFLQCYLLCEALFSRYSTQRQDDNESKQLFYWENKAYVDPQLSMSASILYRSEKIVIQSLERENIEATVTMGVQVSFQRITVAAFHQYKESKLEWLIQKWKEAEKQQDHIPSTRIPAIPIKFISEA